MVDVQVERRLAAILAADVAGYSRLMGEDEEGTLAGLKAHRRELVDHKLKSHRGRLIKTSGDGMLVEFSSAEIRYCRATDGVRLAYAKVGTGPGLLKSAHWLGHLEYDWDFPLQRDFLLGLASSFTLVRYDARGNGLSDWDVGELSLDAWVKDMESVADAAGLDRFPLLGFSQGCAVSIAFAARHPERVSHLILYGGFAVGANKNPNFTAADRERFAAMKTLMKLGWGSDDPTFRQLFTASMLPDATREQVGAFNELQRLSASAECAVRYLETVSDFDVRPLLKHVKAPTLVMHVRDDRRVPIASGRDLAAEIPGARFVALPGKNHMLLSQDPGAPIFQDELRRFLL